MPRKAGKVERLNSLAEVEETTEFPFPYGHTVNIQTKSGSWEQGVFRAGDKGKKCTLTVGSRKESRDDSKLRAIDFAPGEQVEVYSGKQRKDGTDIWLKAKIVTYRSSLPTTPDQLNIDVIEFKNITNPQDARKSVRAGRKGQKVKKDGKPITLLCIKVCPKMCVNAKSRTKNGTTKNVGCKECSGTGLDKKKTVYFGKGWADGAGPVYALEFSKPQTALFECPEKLDARGTQAHTKNTGRITQKFACEVKCVNKGERLGKKGVLELDTNIRKVGDSVLDSTVGGETYQTDNSRATEYTPVKYEKDKAEDAVGLRPGETLEEYDARTDMQSF